MILNPAIKESKRKQFQTIKNVFCFTLLVLMVSAGTTVIGQSERGHIRGMVVDSTKSLMEGASVRLLDGRTLKEIAQTYNEKRGFLLDDLPIGKYMVIIFYPGYKQDSIIVSITIAHKGVTLYETLRPSSNDLEAVVVNSKISPIRVNGDTVSYNASAFKTRVNSGLEELLLRLPGVSIENGILMHLGKPIERVYIDEVDYNIRDPRLITRNLRADQIALVEIYDDKKLKQEDMLKGVPPTTTKAINLKTKKGVSLALTGKGWGGYGGTDKYAAGFNSSTFLHGKAIIASGNANNVNGISDNKFDIKQALPGGITSSLNETINYTGQINSMIKAEVGLSGENVETTLTSASNLVTYLGDSSLSEQHTTTRKNANTSYGFNDAGTFFKPIFATFKFDSVTSGQISPGYNFTRKDNSNTDSVVILTNDSSGAHLANSGSSRNQTSLVNKSVSYGLGFVKKMRGTTLSVQFSQNKNSLTTSGKNYSSLNLFNTNGSLLQRNIVDQIYEEVGSIDNIKTSLNAMHAFKRLESVFSIGYLFDRNENKTVRNANSFDPSDGKYDIADTSGSNTFANKVNIHSIPIYFSKWCNKHTVLLGIQIIPEFGVISNIDYTRKIKFSRNYFDIPRFLTLDYRVNSITIAIASRTITSQPTQEQLQPIPDLSNPILINTGNPDLLPQVTNTINLQLIYLRKKTGNNMRIALGYLWLNNAIVASRNILPGGIQKISYANVQGNYSFDGFLGYQFVLGNAKIGHATIGSLLNVKHDISLFNQLPNETLGLTFGPSVSVKYNASEKLRVELLENLTYTSSIYGKQTKTSTRQVNQSYSCTISYELPAGMQIAVANAQQFHGAIGATPGNSLSILNASFIKNVLPNSRGEIRLIAVDLFDKGKGFSQSFKGNVFESSTINSLGRQIMLVCSYYFQQKKK